MSHRLRLASDGHVLWLPKNAFGLCYLGIFVNQTAEPVLAENPNVGAQSGWMRIPGGWALLTR
jgi:hypothetical protein